MHFAYNFTFPVSSSKTTAIDVYTPTTASAFQGDELPLATISDAPPPEYQVRPDWDSVRQKVRQWQQERKSARVGAIGK